MMFYKDKFAEKCLQKEKLKGPLKWLSFTSHTFYVSIPSIQCCEHPTMFLTWLHLLFLSLNFQSLKFENSNDKYNLQKLNLLNTLSCILN